MKLAGTNAVSSLLVAVLLLSFAVSIHVRADRRRQRTKSGIRTGSRRSNDPIPGCPPDCKCTAARRIYSPSDDTDGDRESEEGPERHGKKDYDVFCRGNWSKIDEMPSVPGLLVAIFKLTLVDYRLDCIGGDFFSKVKRKLRELHLVGNYITKFDSSTFKNFEHLEVLSLRNSSLTSLPEHPFHGTTKLKTLDLSYNQFEDNGFVPSSLCVKDGGGRYPTLETLNLQACGLNRLVRDGFTDCKLRALDLSNNNLSFVGVDELAAFSQKTPVTVDTKINLENNRIHTVSAECGVVDVLESCQQSSEAHVILLLSGNQFCCSDEVLWIRNFTSCIDRDQPCYPSNQTKDGDTLFTFKPEKGSHSNVCERAAEPQHESLIWSSIVFPLGAAVPLVLVVMVIIGCVHYHRRRRSRSHMWEADVVAGMTDSLSSSYGSTGISSDLSSFLVPYTSLCLRERIGTGGFGTVYRAKLHGSTVAVKMLNLDSCAVASAVDDFIREAEVLSKLHHQNIVRLLGLCTDPGHACIVMEYVRRGSVKNMLRTRNTAIGWLPKLRMLVGAANGMVYLHSRQPPVIHRDLKSSNLLVDRQWRVKVCDFGVAKHLKRVAFDISLSSSCGSRNTRAPGTLRFTAPEMMSDRPKLTPKADIYSFAIVMWEFAAASVPPAPGHRNSTEPTAYLCPFADCGWSHQIIEAVCQGRRPSIPANCPAPVQTLMKRCWHRRVRERPTFTEVLETLQLAATEMGLTLSSETSGNEL